MSSLNAWNVFYAHFDPIAFEVFGLKVHWYGLCYVVALLGALFIASFFIKKYPNRFGISSQILESYFLWAEVGVILGARLGYLAVYSDVGLWYYLIHPLDIFNPFNAQGQFIGIAGFSYHGGVVGFLVATIIFSILKKQNLLSILDLATFSIPLAYTLGRIGNFLNKELFGRVIPQDSALGFLGVLVDDELRYPSQLFEAFFEGIVLFVIMFAVFKKVQKTGVLCVTYGIGYALMRFFCEFFREADSQMGYYAFGLSMGQILSVVMFVAGLGVLVYICLHAESAPPNAKRRKNEKNNA